MKMRGMASLRNWKSGLAFARRARRVRASWTGNLPGGVGLLETSGGPSHFAGALWGRGCAESHGQRIQAGGESEGALVVIEGQDGITAQGEGGGKVESVEGAVGDAGAKMFDEPPGFCGEGSQGDFADDEEAAGGECVEMEQGALVFVVVEGAVEVPLVEPVQAHKAHQCRDVDAPFMGGQPCRGLWRMGIISGYGEKEAGVCKATHSRARSAMSMAVKSRSGRGLRVVSMLRSQSPTVSRLRRGAVLRLPAGAGDFVFMAGV